jgi:hypothetical protein
MRAPIATLGLLLLAACQSTHIPDDAPDRAAQYFAAQRGNVDVVARWSAAREQMARMRGVASDALTAPLEWTFLGPGNIGGRTRPLLIDPHDPDTLYAGAVSGGVWKSINAGVRWSTTTDALSNLAVCALAMSPADSRTLFAGTGEGYFREDVRGTALPIRGDGIFVTHDGANSWTQLASTKNNPDFYWVNDLAVSVHDPHRLYAATRTGVWRSSDEGTTWTRVLPATVKGGCLDLALRADAAGDYLFASCGIFEQATVYRATNAESSDAWTPVLTDPQMSRTSLAIAPSKPSVVYALAARNAQGALDQSLLGVYRSDQSGDPGSWVRVQSGDGPLPGSTILVNPVAATQRECNGRGSDNYVSMGWHCNTIAVDPLDENRVWAAGVDLFRSDDGGRSWGVASYWWLDPGASNFSHADHHAIVFDPRYDGAANQTMLVTNDGGIYRTDNARAVIAGGPAATCTNRESQVRFTSLNHNYGVTQFYHGAVAPDGLSFLGGAQDNGSVLGSIVGGVDGWASLWGGDGGFVAIDPANPLTLFVESQNGAIARSSDGGRTFLETRTSSVDDFLFITPFVLDPPHLWTGGTRLLRSEDQGAHWTPATNTLDGQVSAIAVDPARADFVLAGTTTGKVYRSDSATTSSSQTWASAKPRDGWVASLTFDGATVYATYAQFGGPHIWKSADGAQTWTAIDGNLPDLPVHTLVAYRDQLFIGTDLGIFTTIDGGATWTPLANFPSVITEALVINHNALYAFTHGRGAWRAQLDTPPRRRAGAR